MLVSVSSSHSECLSHCYLAVFVPFVVRKYSNNTRSLTRHKFPCNRMLSVLLHCNCNSIVFCGCWCVAVPAFSIHLSRSTGNRNIMLKAVLLGFLMRLTACSMQQYRTHDDNTERDNQTNKQKKKRTSILLANPIMLIYYAVMILKMPSV